MANSDREELLQALTPLSTDVPPDILRDFVTRMDGEYFRRIPLPTIAQHVRLAAALTPDHLSECSVSEVRDGHFELTVVAYDYFAEFATICGLLSAFGLNIEEGQIYTFSESVVSSSPTRPSYGEGLRRRPKLRPGLSRKKIVDVFRVQPVGDASFTPEDQVRFAGELRSLIGLLDEGTVRGSPACGQSSAGRTSGQAARLVQRLAASRPNCVRQQPIADRHDHGYPVGRYARLSLCLCQCPGDEKRLHRQSPHRPRRRQAARPLFRPEPLRPEADRSRPISSSCA